ncbi:hypothetical protein O181_046135 [Austropuccinia psidii MF-1]|uniref:Uncharacterized protein n=1 Tax=Austropuccinia psidii MF-1 TaxID=1389203 RepID=A0A9Q3DSR6_9BASI|nr:hypothetical protein [Austropuccinia psidii MF-1]
MASSLISNLNNSIKTPNSLYHSALSNLSNAISTNQLLTPLLPLSQHLSKPFMKCCLEAFAAAKHNLEALSGLVQSRVLLKASPLYVGAHT